MATSDWCNPHLIGEASEVNDYINNFEQKDTMLYITNICGIFLHFFVSQFFDW